MNLKLKNKIAIVGVRVACIFGLATPSLAIGEALADFAFNEGFISVPLVTKSNFKQFVVTGTDEGKPLVKKLCDEVGARFSIFKWDAKPCGDVVWRAKLITGQKNPLIYAVFGEGEETTLFLGGVHPDELTPIPTAFRFARHLAEHPELYKGLDVRVIVAPLVNPDGFLRKAASRTNANGVDLNRNLFTVDWYNRAKKWWEDRRERAPSHFPGFVPNSEIESLFQIQMIEEFLPDKILSLHAPLGFLDYDGPGSALPRSLTESENRAKRLVHAISESSRNYRIVDYSFYPGSLGNYAGNERNIPTVTLELETTDPNKVDEYWKQFLPGFEALIRYPFKKHAQSNTQNVLKFFGDYETKLIQEARTKI